LLDRGKERVHIDMKDGSLCGHRTQMQRDRRSVNLTRLPPVC
jgi:hypothetical protein